MKTMIEKLNSMGLTDAQKKDVLGLMMCMCTFQNVSLRQDINSRVMSVLFVNGLGMPYIAPDPSFLSDKRAADAIGLELE